MPRAKHCDRGSAEVAGGVIIYMAKISPEGQKISYANEILFKYTVYSRLKYRHRYSFAYFYYYLLQIDNILTARG